MKKILSLLFALCAGFASAQDITNHALPVGGGPGVIGWKTVGPCAASQLLIWPTGASGDPACASSIPITSLGLGNGTSTVPSLFFTSEPTSGWYRVGSGIWGLTSSLTSAKFNGATGVSILLHDPTIFGTVGSAAGNVGGFKFNLSYGPTRFTNGPIGEPNYNDDVWAFGHNVAGPGGRIDNTKPAVYLQWESKFYDGVRFGSEFHLEQITEAGVSKRPMSFFLPRDGGTGSGLSFGTDYADFYTYGGVQKVSIQTLAGVIDLLASMKLRGGVTNVPMVTQLNEAGNAYLNLPFLRSGDVLGIFQGITVTGPRVGSTGPVGEGIFAYFSPATATTGDSLMVLQGPSVTGDFNTIFAAASVSGDNRITLRNSGAGTATMLLEAGTGDAQIQFAASLGTSSWTMGVDNSDSDKLKISAGSVLGTGDRITIDTAVVTFGLPAKLPSYTVVGVPSAATAGAGAMIYVTDETGGAVPAFSDGTNWRRVTDRAIIS